MIPQLSTVPNAGLPAGFRKKTPNGNARMGAGVMFTSKDGKALFLRRRGADHPGEWAFPGGMVEEDEEPADAARREAMEEVGQLGGWGLAPLQRETKDEIDFTTFGQPVAMEFEPTLNGEHDAYQWAPLSSAPQPLHPGVARLLAKFFSEEAEEKDHAESGSAEELRRKLAGDQAKISHAEALYVDIALDPAKACGHCVNFTVGSHCEKVVDPIAREGHCKLFVRRLIGATDLALALALDDKNSTRSVDSDGRMRISVANISKANICPYKGEEIPGWEELGLEPDKVYQMFRDPRELEAAAPTFNSIQLLKKHLPVDADDHQMWDIVGCTGTDAKFDGTYLTNSLSIWTQEGIDFIESGKQRELSCGYHYTPDMTAGTFGGKSFDGVMRNIEGNHVALVEEGRAGHDVVVGDSALDQKDDDMPTRLEYAVLMRTAAAVNPLLAKNAKVEYGPIFRGLTMKNFRQRKPVIMDSVRKAIAGKTIARDASVEHLAHMLDQFEHTPHAEKSWDESVSGPQHRAMEAAAHGHSNLGIPAHVGKEFEKADTGKKFGDMIRDWAKDRGFSDDDYAALDKMHMDAMKLPGAEVLGDEEENVNIEVEEGEEGSKDRRGRAKDRRGRARDKDVEQEEAEEADDGEIEQEEADDEVEQEEADDQLSNLGAHAQDRHRADDRRSAKDRRGARDRRKGAMDMITSDDMNKAIASAVATERKRNYAALEARAFVRPYVGDLVHRDMALDSAEKVLRTAARMMQIEGADTIHASALKPLIKMAGQNRSTPSDNFQGGDELAFDSSGGDDTAKLMDEMFPGAGRIGIM